MSRPIIHADALWKTPWYDLTPYLANGVTPSSSIPDARFRRVDDQVEFAMKVDVSGNYTGNSIALFPTGFRAPGYRYLPGAYIAAGAGAGASLMDPLPMIGYIINTNLQTPSNRPITGRSTLIWTGRFDTTDPRTPL